MEAARMHLRITFRTWILRWKGFMRFRALGPSASPRVDVLGRLAQLLHSRSYKAVRRFQES